jgi:hypothetical protein
VALPAQIAALLLTEHAREPFAGPVLAYGPQRTNFSYDGALWMLESLGIRPDPAGMADPPPAGAFIDLARLVRLLGLGELHTLDELNVPVPFDLMGRFGTIVDAGALDRVFDVRLGLTNTSGMLRPGGRVVHVAPVNNQVNHGFVQPSPTLFQDYYVENGFDDVRGIMIVQPRTAAYAKRWNFFPYDHATMGGVNSMFCSADTQLSVYFTARKNAASTSGRVPIQSYFTRLNEFRDARAEQVVVTHGATRAAVRTIDDPEPQAGAVVLFNPIWTLEFGS